MAQEHRQPAEAVLADILSRLARVETSAGIRTLRRGDWLIDADPATGELTATNVRTLTRVVLAVP